MKKLFFVITTACMPFIATFADDKVNAMLGISAEGGFSNLFFSPIENANYQPLLGGGAGATLNFEFEYKKFLFHTGIGTTYTMNRNFFHITENPLSIILDKGQNLEYVNMTEKTSYIYGYIPVKLGMKFQRWYFLAGSKVGLYCLDGRSANNLEVVSSNEQKDLMYEYFTNAPAYFGFNNLNVMLSAEVGLDINKFIWKEKPQSANVKMDAAQRYREAKRKKSLAERTHYRVALFADFGLNNIQNSEINYRPYGSKLYRGHNLHNFMTGIKVSATFELPQSEPKGNPYFYLYVKDELTEKPISNASVKIQRKGAKSVSQKTTDVKRGRVARSMVPGMYWAKVSHTKYCPTDTIHFVHNDDYDTLYVSLHLRHTFRVHVKDANTLKPITAHGQFVPNNQTNPISATSDTTGVMTVSLDDRIGYIVKAQSNGYNDYCDTVDALVDDLVIKMIPQPIKKQTFILRNMHFATAQTDILPSSKSALDLLYKLLIENPNLYIKIVGHTDDVGSEQDNRILSEGRANSIREAMLKRGISASRLKIQGKGESEPIVPNDTEAHKQMNRRVEIEILSGAENINIELLQ